MPSSIYLDQDPPAFAIVGMSCRLPGGISSCTDFWHLLLDGVRARCKVPKSRMRSHHGQQGNLQEPRDVESTEGYFIQRDLRDFDNEVFGINSLEATYMDPQQRQLLEVVFECVENAGLRLEDLSGSDIGCFVANFTNDFTIMQTKDPKSLHRYSTTGMGPTPLSNRLNHVFNLKGPSFTIDTACSSSLYALHLACNALANGECSGAIVSGANLMLTPEVSAAVSKAGILSASGDCNTFSNAADGYGRAEAVGALFLRRLPDAQINGDNIRSIIRGSAINSNGHTVGVTHPSKEGQSEVIQKAYQRAQLSLKDTQYVECHGEIAAAYAARHLSARQAILCAYYRGRVLSEAPRNGAMLAVGLSSEAAKAELHRKNLQVGKVQIACVNSPNSVTLSGDEDAIKHLSTTLSAGGVFNRLLKTDGKAYHSYHMLALGSDYEELLKRVLDHSPAGVERSTSIRMFSSTTGRQVSASETCQATYWRRNLEQPVLFSTAVAAFASKESYHFLEIGPHHALKTPVLEILKHCDLTPSTSCYGSMLVRNTDSGVSALLAVGSLFLHGHSLNFGNVNGITAAPQHPTHDLTQARFITDLPTYRWNHENHLWSEPRSSYETRTSQFADHELIGSSIPGGDGKTFLWRNVLRTSDIPWMVDHRLGDSIIFPSAGYIAMAIEALCQVVDRKGVSRVLMKDVKFPKFLNVSDLAGQAQLFLTLRRLGLSATAASTSWWEFEVALFHQGTSSTHASGKISAREERLAISSAPLQESPNFTTDDISKWYARFDELGLVFGNSFRTLTKLSYPKRQDVLLARCEALPPDRLPVPLVSEQKYIIHPATIDAVIQACLISTSAGRIDALGCKVPVSLSSLELDLHACMAQKSFSIGADSERVGMKTFLVNGRLFNDRQELALELSHIRAVSHRVLRLRQPQATRKPLLSKAWMLDPFLYGADKRNDLTNATQEINSVHTSKHKVCVVTTGKVTDLDKSIVSSLENGEQFEVSQMPATANAVQNLPPKSTVIVTVEAESRILKAPSPETFAAIKTIINKASCVLWLTNASDINEPSPDASLVCGWAEALKMEEPSLIFTTLRLATAQEPASITGKNVRTLLGSILSKQYRDRDLVQKDGKIFVSRFTAADILNERLCERQDQSVVTKAQRDIGDFHLTIDTPGQFDTLKFVCEERAPQLEPGYVRLRTMCAGLNAKDLFVLSDKVDVKHSTTSHEFAGIVEELGEGVHDLKTGDRVVAMGPGYFSNHQQVPASCCVPLQDHETPSEVCALPIVFASALYALHDRAHIQTGESVLIHSATSGLGQATIQIARLHGAQIFATVGSDSKRQHLIDEYRLEPDHIFSSRDANFVAGVMKATAEVGVDIVVNTLTGEMLHDTWSVLAPFGRFIELGKQDILDSGKLDMGGFRKDTTFSSFDLTDLYYSKAERHRQKFSDLLKQVVLLYREKKIQPATPTAKFDVSDTKGAFRALSSRARMGKVVVSFENPEAEIEVERSRYASRFDPSKSYLMVGCLGGLGRSISNWMHSQGAKIFIFLSRSGIEKPAAKSFVHDLQAKGATVDIIQGDVSNSDDVEKAVKAAMHRAPIGGVIQAAMGLSGSLFTNMTLESWSAAIAPKVTGTWNLHHALRRDDRDQTLDFFFMTSSITATLGTIGESAYSAANAFLEGFAHYRRSLGLPATALALGMIAQIGYVAENPEVETALKRQRLRPVGEEELLGLIDVALSAATAASSSTSQGGTQGGMLDEDGPPRDVAILSGWETLDGPNPLLASDPRFSQLMHESNPSTQKQNQYNITSKDVLDALDNGTPLLEAVQKCVTAKFASLILSPADKVDPQKGFADFGIDSMLGTELRAFVFEALAVDVPFNVFVGGTSCVVELSQMIVEELEGRLSD
ncbi:MAG: hypothetical protein Q9162_004827 [Coniocarpon cinnabarinum]